MIEKLRNALYVLNESHPDTEVIMRSLDGRTITIGAIAPRRAACVTVQGKRKLDKMELIVPASALRRAKSLGNVLEHKMKTILPNDWRIETFRILERADKIAAAVVRMNDLGRIKELLAKKSRVHELYYELIIGEGIVECAGDLGKITIHAELILPGRIGLNIRYLVEAVKYIATQDTISLEVIQHKGLHILALVSACERHYIVEMSPQR